MKTGFENPALHLPPRPGRIWIPSLIGFLLCLNSAAIGELNPIRIGDWPGYRRGPAYSVAVAGQFAYVATEVGLQVIDVSDPPHPQRVGHPTEQFGYAVIVQGQRAYTAVGGEFAILDLSNPREPKRLSSRGFPNFSIQAIAVAENYGYLVGTYFSSDGSVTQGRLIILDLTALDTLRLVSVTDVAGDVRAVTVSGRHVYVGSVFSTPTLSGDRRGFMVYDVSERTRPQQVAAMDQRPIGVLVSGAYAFLLGEAGDLTVVDVSAPAKPLRVASVPTGTSSGDLAMSGNRIYAVGGRNMRIVDVGDPVHPRAIGGFEGWSAESFAVAVAGDYAYLVGQPPGLFVVDVRNPASPALTGAFDTSGETHHVAASGRYAFVGDRNLLVLDLANPIAPSVIGSYETPEAPQALLVSGQIACVVAQQLLLLDVSEPTAPRRVGSLPFDVRGVCTFLIQDMAASGKLVYLAEGLMSCLSSAPSNQPMGRLSVVDIRDPAQPRRVGAYEVSGYGQAVAVSGNRVALLELKGEGAQQRGAVHLLDVSNPTSPRRLNFDFETPGPSGAVALSDRFLCLALTSGGFFAFDLANPDQTKPVGSRVILGGNVTDITLQGDRAFVSATAGGVQVIDLSDVSGPRLRGSYWGGQDRAVQTALFGDYLLVANGVNGLTVLDLKARIALETARVTVREHEGHVTIPVRRSGVTSLPTTVQYASVAGTAMAGMDYTPVEGVLDFGREITQQSITIPILDDTLDEGAESLQITLSSPGRDTVLGANARTEVVIMDEPAVVQFAEADSSVAEDRGTALVMVLKRGDAPATVEFSTHDGTGKASVDYESTSGTLRFANGDGSRTIAVPILDNGLVDGVKTIMLTLFNPSPGTIVGSPATATLTIGDNEKALPCLLDLGFRPPADLTAGTLSLLLAEANGEVTMARGANLVHLLADGSVANTRPLALDAAQRWGGTVLAVEPDGSFLALRKRAMVSEPIPPGQPGPPGPIITLPESAEVQKFNPDGTLVADGSFSVIGRPVVQLSLTPPTADGKRIVYGMFQGSVLRLNANGSVDQTFELAPLVNAYRISAATVQEADKRIVVARITAVEHPLVRLHPNGAIDASFATTFDRANGNLVSVTALGVQPDGKIMAAGSGPGANGAEQPVCVRFNVDGTVDPSFRMPLSTLPGLADRLVPQTDGKCLVFTKDGALVRLNPAGSLDTEFDTGTQRSQSTVGLVNVGISDAIVESDGDILFAGSFTSVCGIARPGLARLRSEQRAAWVQFSMDSYTSSEGDGEVTIAVERLGNASTTVAVDYSTGDGSAQAGTDYTTQSGELVFAPLEPTKSIRVPILNDGLRGPDRVFYLNLTDSASAGFVGPRSKAEIRIVDNDSGFVFASRAYSVAEDAVSLTLSVLRGDDLAGPVSVDYETQDGTAVGGQEFLATFGTLRFAAGETNKTISIRLLNDSVAEDDESFSVRLVNPTPGTSLGDVSAAVVTIQDNDFYYYAGFESGVGPEWSTPQTGLTPVGNRRFLGQFGNETVTLSLTNLPVHQADTVSFDLFIIQSWDGDSPWGGGPDVWDLSVREGPTLLHTTFSNTESFNPNQAFPGNFPGEPYPPRTGARENNSLGYPFYGDAVYHLTFTFPHASDVLTLNFSGAGLQDLSDESWGLDNFRLDLLATSQAPPVLTFQPSDVVLVSGNAATFGASAYGAAPLRYQWRFNGNPLPAGVSNVLTLAEVQKTDAGAYDVVVANNYGSVTSRVAVLTVLLQGPEITAQPVDQTVFSGSTVDLSVTATGSLPLAYQWERNGVALGDGNRVFGARTATLTLSGVGIEDVGIYSVLVSNEFGSMASLAAVLDVTMAPPRITLQPRNPGAALGSSVALEVRASGSLPLTYQWQRNGSDLVDGPWVSGSRTNTLLIRNLNLSDLGRYSVLVSNTMGWMRSASVELTTWNAVLSAVNEASRLVVTWNDAGKGMTLQRNASVESPAWQDVAGSEGTNVMSFPMSEAMVLFRLVRGTNLPPYDRMVWIPPGTFVMGSPPNEVDRFEWEGPQTAVTISRGFWMGKYEVTQGEFLAVMSNNPSYFLGDTNSPVERVSWFDATNYCGVLTQRERTAGRISSNSLYRLPTEAEREYACRAGTSTRFSYGDDPGYTDLTNYAWYWGNSGGTTHPVGQKLPNPWGLCDMYGNVWEWCQDWFGPYPGGIAVDPQGPAVGSERVPRGGSWGDGTPFSTTWMPRSALRGRDGPDIQANYVGFRVVLAPTQP